MKKISASAHPLSSLPSFFNRVIPLSHIVHYEPGEWLIHSGDQQPPLFYVLQGKAKIFMIHENGRRSLLKFIEQGDFIGELSLLEIEKRTKDVIATDHITCLVIPAVEARRELLNNNEFLLHLSRFLGTKVLQRVDQFTNNQSFELKYRLATYILKSEVNGYYHEKHTETADFLGVSYRHLLYTLRQFQDEGLLTKKGRGFLINTKGLEAFEITNYY